MSLEAPKVRAGACAAARLEGPGQTAHHQERAVRLQRPLAGEGQEAVGASVQNRRVPGRTKTLQTQPGQGQTVPALQPWSVEQGGGPGSLRGDLEGRLQGREQGNNCKNKEVSLRRGGQTSSGFIFTVSGWSRAGSNQRELPGESGPPSGREGTTRDSSGGPSSSVHGPLQDPAIGTKSKGELLKYIVYGDRSVEHSKKKRPGPRKNSHNPEDVPVGLALRTQTRALPRQEFLTDQRAKYQRTESEVSHVRTFYRSRSRFQQRSGERKRGGTAGSRNQYAQYRKRAQNRS